MIRGAVQVDSEVFVIDGARWSRAALEDRVVEVEAGIAHYRELHANTAPGFVVMRDKMNALAAPHGSRYASIIDLSGVGSRPKGAYKEALWKNMRATTWYVAMVQPGSVVLRTVLRFFMAKTQNETSVHATFEEALEAARAYRGRCA